MSAPIPSSSFAHTIDPPTTPSNQIANGLEHLIRLVLAMPTPVDALCLPPGHIGDALDRALHRRGLAPYLVGSSHELAERGDVPGIVTAVRRRGEVHVDAIGGRQPFPEAGEPRIINASPIPN